MAHTHDALAAFQNGEVRLIYARHRGTGDLYLLPDDEAIELRVWTKENLRCPIPDCPSPEMTTVHRARLRDGFRHLTPGSGGHAPESLFHMQSAEMIARWLRGRYPRSTVVKEEASNARRERVADVMLTAADVARTRMAFEIQYSPITDVRWSERHRSYAKQEITDVWLFGHFGTQLRTTRDQVKLNPAHEAAAKSGLALWVNPITEQIATVVTQADVGDGLMRAVPCRSGRGELLAVPLSSFGFRGTRFTCPEFEELLEAEVLAVAEAASEERRRVAAQRSAAEAQKRAERVARAESEARLKLIMEWAAGEGEALSQRPSMHDLVAGWATSAERGELLQSFGGRWPGFLALDLERGELPLPVEVWQGTVFRRLIMWAPHGQKVSLGQSLGILGLADPVVPEHLAVVGRWLENLSFMGIVERRARFDDDGLPVFSVIDQAEHGRAEAVVAGIGPRPCERCTMPLWRRGDLWRGTHDSCAVRVSTPLLPIAQPRGPR
ncbi:hypothetical protein [Cryobacterium sp. N22]|uniref:competence protein CoiA family protein n=1 Tax=Cryobacterium sp. N22 TaxID=2048290 RepID=UPI0011B03CB7|nr:hypothetical protein [Cryobacterium sp. N22]